MFEQIKLDIAKLVERQKLLKPQRKTVCFVGNRTHSTQEAASLVSESTYTLRHLYIVYGILRNKTLDQIEPKRKTKPYQPYIDRLLEKYKSVEITI